MPLLKSFSSQFSESTDHDHLFLDILEMSGGTDKQFADDDNSDHHTNKNSSDDDAGVVWARARPAFSLP